MGTRLVFLQIVLQKNEIINLYLKCSPQRTFKIDIKKSSLNLVPKSLGLILTIKGWGCFYQSQVKNAVYLLNFDSIRVQFWQGILCLFSLVLTAISQWLIKPMRQIVLQKNEIINLYLKCSRQRTFKIDIKKLGMRLDALLKKKAN